MRKSHKQKVQSRRVKKSDKIRKRLISRLESFWFNSYKEMYDKEYTQAFIPREKIEDSVLTVEKLEECCRLIKELDIKPLENTTYYPTEDYLDTLRYYPLMYGGVTAKNASICVLSDSILKEQLS